MVFADEGNLVESGGCSNDTIRKLRNDRWIDLLHCHGNRSVESHVSQY